MKMILKKSGLYVIIGVMIAVQCVLGVSCKKEQEVFEEAKAVTEANTYISENKGKTNDVYRGKYHLTPPVGWMNDPNGFVYYKGKYHCFYQFHPFAATNGVMYWGHAVSEDLVKWEQLGVAIAPDMNYDRDGCWSGTAVEKDGRLYLIYTGHTEKNGKRVQTQNIAYSDDGVVFQKYTGNPVVGESLLPAGTSVADFRDPYVWEKDGTYYMLVGTMEQGAAKVLLYHSENLFDWEYVNVFLRRINSGFCWECPNLVPTGEGDLFVVSPVDYPHAEHEFWNYNSSVYAVGQVNYGSGTMTASAFREVDMGLDFYAPQITASGGGAVMIAWMNMWARSYPTAEMRHGWTGSMTLPRTVTVQGGKLYQRPVAAVRNYFGQTKSAQATFSGQKTFENIGGNCCAVKVSADLSGTSKFTVSLFSDGTAHTDLSYDCERGIVMLDRTESGRDIHSHDEREFSKAKLRTASYPLKDGKLQLEIYLDKSSIEVFFGDGELVMTTLAYPPAAANGITFFSEGNATLIVEQNDILIK